MGIVVGVRTSANTTSTNQAIDMDSVMKYIQDYQTPIQQFYIMNKDASKEVINKKSKFEWHEKTVLGRSFTLAAAVTGGSTTDTITQASADGTLMRYSDVLFVESTGDMLIVTQANPITTSATVRKVGSGNITAIADGATIRIIVPAFTENYTRQPSLSNNADNKYGYCQIGLDAIAMSGREDAGEAYTDGESFSDLSMEKANLIKIYEERKFLYSGTAYLDSTNNITYSAGARGVITTNIGYWNGELDEAEIEDQLELVMSKNDGGEVVGYCGSKYIKGLNKIFKDRFTYNTNDIISVYGGITKKSKSDPAMVKYFSPWGLVTYVWEPMLEGDVYSNACLYLNKNHHRMRYMKNDKRGSRKYRVEPNVQDPGTGNFHDQWMWDTGVEIREEVMHGWHLKA